jgi:light-harvesting complex I chlorophyll a/b binding protein 1
MEKDPEKKKYPGGAFDPLGYSKDPKKFHEYKIKEVKNGKQELFVAQYNSEDRYRYVI